MELLFLLTVNNAALFSNVRTNYKVVRNHLGEISNNRILDFAKKDTSNLSFRTIHNKYS